MIDLKNMTSTLDTKENFTEPSYWLFQCNPKNYHIFDALKNGVLDNWLVNQYKKEIKKGDKVIFWISSKNPGVYALATITSEIKKFNNKDYPSFKYNVEVNYTEKKDRVDLSLDYNLIENPILKDFVLNNRQLKTLDQGRTGTNFKATKDQYDEIVKVINSTNFSSDYLISELEIRKFAIEVFKYLVKRYGETFLQKVAVSKISLHSKNEKYNSYSIPDFFTQGVLGAFKSERNKVNIKDKSGRTRFSLENLNLLGEKFIYLSTEWAGTGNSNLRFDQLVKFIESYSSNELTASSNNGKGPYRLIKRKSIPLNQILYGPPGTGKTYNVINEALAIIENKDSDKDYITKTDDERKIITTRFNKLKTEGRISFITFHQSYSYEDFVLGIMPDLDSSASSGLKFIRKEGVFYRIVQKAKIDSENKYVLVIDEINRANISRVFGELITLIEDDKRINQINELKVQLPNEKIEKNSKGEDEIKEFGVPSNLYILGTMNTADKSIAALDIALRRRFVFKPYYPDVTKIEDNNLASLMKKLNDLIEDDSNGSNKFYKGADFTIGHSYFMKKNINDKADIFNNKVIPLLMEYYMNNISLVKDLLEKTGIMSEKLNGTLKIL